MFKCSGICSQCGRCFEKEMTVKTAGLKPAVILYPEDFRPDRLSCGFGVALDIGTTTIAGTLWDLEKGVQLSAGSVWNSQAEYGSDVISRITFCRGDALNLMLMRDAVTGCSNRLIGELCRKAGIAAESVIKVTVCGNTVMSHFFAGCSPEGLALAPFTPAYKGGLTMTGTESGLNVSEYAQVSILPGIAGHIGGDITAGINAVRLDRPRGEKRGIGLTLYADIGTNGEIVLSDDGRLYACSTAAGPAFEGGCISCGMRACEGAVEEVSIDNGVFSLKTIGNAPAKGLCGSGLIDAAAKLLDAGLIDETGKLAETVYLSEDKKVFLNQKDIRELQLAKSAIRAGIKALLNKAGREEQDIERIIIAGAFGSSIPIKSAMRIGLLPEKDTDRFVLAGNAAGAGAAMALTSEREEKRTSHIADLVDHVELATEPEFQELFIEYINF